MLGKIAAMLQKGNCIERTGFADAWVPMQSLVVLMADDSNQEVLVQCWQALVAVAGSIPKEMMPSYVRTLKEAVSTAKEKERRKRRPLPIRVAGFCLPKALQPVLPVFLQGVLQVLHAFP